MLFVGFLDPVAPILRGHASPNHCFDIVVAGPRVDASGICRARRGACGRVCPSSGRGGPGSSVG
jgi:hypothetical protein